MLRPVGGRGALRTQQEKKMTKQGRKKNAGFTLVELMIVVAIIGILAAIAIPAFSRYVKKSRTAEALGQIAKICSASVAYYETDHADSTGAVLPKQFAFQGAIGIEAACCGQSGDLCPAIYPGYAT